VTWSLASPRKSVRQGEKFTALLRADIPGGWHLYSLTEPPDGPVATVISVADGGGFVLVGRPTARNPDVQPPDNNFAIVTETYSDSVTFVIPVAARSAGLDTLV